MSYTPKCGDRVHVEFDGVVVEHAKVVDDRGVPHSISFFSNPLVVTKAEPDNWPPQPGDVWEAEGKVYGVRKHSFMQDKAVIFRVDGNDESYSESYRDDTNLSVFKALNPELVKRQDAS